MGQVCSVESVLETKKGSGLFSCFTTARPWPKIALEFGHPRRYKHPYTMRAIACEAPFLRGR